MQLKIGVIINSAENEQDYKACIQDSSCQFYFRVSALTAAVDVAKELIADYQVDAIITMMATSRILSKNLNIPVVPLGLKSFDVLRALWLAGHMGMRPAFVEIETEVILYDYQEIIRILGFEVKRYQFRGLDKIPQLADEIMRDGCDVVASMGTKTVEELRKRGLETLLFLPGSEAFLTAVDEVKRICSARLQEMERSKWLDAVVNEVGDGILMWDSGGTLRLLNRTAQRALRQPPEALLGKNILALQREFPFLEAIFSVGSDYTTSEYDGNEYVITKQEIWNGDQLLGTIGRLSNVKDIRDMELRTRRNRSENGFVATIHFTDIRGNSPAITTAKETAQKYAQSGANILITGESGSGKEMFAQGIHNYSQYWAGPFVAVNCSALTDTLLESELFGYEEGAFTGALRSGHPGLFELAHGGTLFMDEVGEMSLNLQVKLLRVLQERSVRRVGGKQNIPLDVRFIFATNRNLAEEVRSGRFRSDLFYRINVLPLKIPPLRERKEDIPAIGREIAAQILRKTGLGYTIPAACIQALRNYDWPGNVRELSNVIERMIILGLDTPEQVETLLAEIRQEAQETPHTSAEKADDTRISVPVGSMRDMEASIVNELFRRCQGDRKKLEQITGLSRSTLWRYLKERE